MRENARMGSTPNNFRWEVLEAHINVCTFVFGVFLNIFVAEGVTRGAHKTLTTSYNLVDHIFCDFRWARCGGCTRNAFCPAVTLLKVSLTFTVQTDQRTTINQHSAAIKNKSINNGTQIGYNSSSLMAL
jgi:hypothetical protein